jgi:hypothetical protein
VRHRRATGPILALAVLLAACGGADDPAAPGIDPSPDDAAAEPPPAEDGDDPVTLDTPEGEVVLDLAVTPEQVAIDGAVDIELRNEGDTEVGVGREHHVERWDGDGWERLDWPEGYGWTDDLPLLAPGDALGLGTWPHEDGGFDAAGWYRATTSMPVPDGDPVDLHAPFEVTGR